MSYPGGKRDWTGVLRFARMGSPGNRTRRIRENELLGIVQTGEVSMGIATMTAATVSGVAVVACYAAAPLPAPAVQTRPAAD
ncbi:hypothetical protein C8D78_2063 [Arthrobacter oryzae]|uniref:Uncharacterized protein n=1 Tax=Arthrobacter oryzae TaxID=409290 RepID=A0A495ETD7_9MICC|nr:hypothetical protein C8D78_2063 [Arthrobacter oryzae]